MVGAKSIRLWIVIFDVSFSCTNRGQLILFCVFAKFSSLLGVFLTTNIAKIFGVLFIVLFKLVFSFPAFGNFYFVFAGAADKYALADATAYWASCAYPLPADG